MPTNPIFELLLGKPQDKKEEATQQGQVTETVKVPSLGTGVTWRHHLPDDVHNEINSLVKETHRYRDAYKKTLKVRDAQLWVALAHVNQRLRKIEKTLESLEK